MSDEGIVVVAFGGKEIDEERATRAETRARARLKEAARQGVIQQGFERP